MGGAKEKAEGAEGVSEGGLAKEKLEGPEPKGAVVATEKAGGAEEAQVVGTEKAKLDDDAEDTGGAGAMLNGAAEGVAAGARRAGAAAGGKPRFGNVAGADGMEADGMEAATLGGWAAKAPVKRKCICFHLIKSCVYKQRWLNLEALELDNVNSYSFQS